MGEKLGHSAIFLAAAIGASAAAQPALAQTSPVQKFDPAEYSSAARDMIERPNPLKPEEAKAYLEKATDILKNSQTLSPENPRYAYLAGTMMFRAILATNPEIAAKPVYEFFVQEKANGEPGRQALSGYKKDHYDAAREYSSFLCQQAPAGLTKAEQFILTHAELRDLSRQTAVYAKLAVKDLDKKLLPQSALSDRDSKIEFVQRAQQEAGKFHTTLANKMSQWGLSDLIPKSITFEGVSLSQMKTTNMDSLEPEKLADNIMKIRQAEYAPQTNAAPAACNFKP